MHVGLVITGAPLASRANDLIEALTKHHRVTAIPSPASQTWVAVDDRWLSAGRVRPDALVVVPATFNTLNQWAAGINDTPVLNVLNDALGLGIPILAVPMAADRLTKHPAWTRTLDLLRQAGVELLDPQTGRVDQLAAIESGSGDQVAQSFDTVWITSWVDLQ